MITTELRNKYEGERIFLIGNGPSLEKTPLGDLDQEYTFAVNDINAIYDDVDWRPDFYYYHRSRFDDWEAKVQQNVDLGMECFIWEGQEKYFGKRENIHYLTMYDLIPRAKTTPVQFHERDIEDVKHMTREELYNYWSDDIEELIYHHHSMYGIYQIISYLGFDYIYLLGTDLGFEPVTPHMIFDSGEDPLEYSSHSSFAVGSISNMSPLRSIVNGIAYKILLSEKLDTWSNSLLNIISAEDGDHFGSDYNLTPRDYTHLNREIRRNHYVVKRISSFEDFDIYNATVGGELEIFQRVDIEEVLNQ